MFVSLGLTGGTIALLATGVTGVVFIVSTVPAMVCPIPRPLFRDGTDAFQVDHRQSGPQAHAPRRLAGYVLQHGHRRRDRGQIRTRLARPRSSRLDRRR